MQIDVEPSGPAVPASKEYFQYGPFRGEKIANVATSREAVHTLWIAELQSKERARLPTYQQRFLQYLDEQGISLHAEMVDQQECEHEFISIRGSNGYVEKLECKKCGYKCGAN